MIEIQHLTQKYGKFTALEDLNLTIKDGEIFGLIGHNGAGKTTTIKSLVSIIEPTSGEIFIDGKNLRLVRDACKRSIAYVADSPDLFLKIQVITYWQFIQAVYQIPDAEFHQRLNALCTLFDLEGKFYHTIEELSHGMRQKVFLIAALLPQPKHWILDEPMTGLDPQSAYNLKDLMRNHTTQGNTVLFSTHVLEVAEQLCDRIGILRKGKLLFVGTMAELKSRYPGTSLEEIYLGLVGHNSPEAGVHHD